MPQPGGWSQFLEGLREGMSWVSDFVPKELTEAQKARQAELAAVRPTGEGAESMRPCQQPGCGHPRRSHCGCGCVCLVGGNERRGGCKCAIFKEAT